MNNGLSSREREIWELQSRIIPQILNIKHLKLLQNIEKALKIVWENQVVALTPDGKPMTQKMEMESILQGIKEAKNGDVMSIEELMAETEILLK